MHAPQRDLASVEVWDRSLERSRRRRVLAAQGRREVARRKQASAAAAAAMVVSPTAAAFAAAGAGSGGGSTVGAASAANRAIAPGAPADLLRLGDTGPDVIRVQSALGQTPDGVFGPRTDRAVRTFQSRNGLLVDGIVGPHTWGTLFGPHGASYDPVTPRYQFKIQRASAVEEARVRPALAGKGPVAKIVLKTTPAAGRGTTAPASRHGHRRAATVPAVDRSSPAPQHHSSPPRSSAPVSTSCGSSRIVSPVRGGMVTGDFGEQRPGHIHSGIDLAVAYGTPIVAAACGVVTTASAQGGYGNLVCVKHSSTLTTCYAHMSRFATRVGQRVHQGQVIGYVGCTGSCTGPHVHFETRVNGSPVDPAPYLSGSRRARVTTVHASSSKPSTRSSRVRTASSGGKPSSSATRLRSAGGAGGASSASGPGDSSQSSAQTAQPAAAPAPEPAPAPAAQAAPAPAPQPAPAPAAQSAPAPAPAPAPAAAQAPAPEPQAAPEPAPAAQAAPDPAPAPAQQAPAEPAPAPQQAAPEPVKPEPAAQAAPAAEQAPAAEAPSAPAEPAAAPTAEAPAAPAAAAPEAPAASPTE